MEKGFLSGFLILGFAIFIAGFLAGMLAFAVVQASSDLATLGLMIFVLGFVVGMLTVALTFIFMKWRRKQHEDVSEPEIEN